MTRRRWVNPSSTVIYNEKISGVQNKNCPRFFSKYSEKRQFFTHLFKNIISIPYVHNEVNALYLNNVLMIDIITGCLFIYV